jgi:hypothetical protein
MFEDPTEGPPRLIAAASLPMNAPQKTPDPGSGQATPAAYGPASLLGPAPGRRRPTLRQRLHRFVQLPGTEVVVGGLIVASVGLAIMEVSVEPLSPNRAVLERARQQHPAPRLRGRDPAPRPVRVRAERDVELLVHLKERYHALLIAVRGASGEGIVNPSEPTFRGGHPIVVLATRELDVGARARGRAGRWNNNYRFGDKSCTGALRPQRRPGWTWPAPWDLD